MASQPIELKLGRQFIDSLSMPVFFYWIPKGRFCFIMRPLKKF